MVLRGLLPIIDRNARVLLLGSFPSCESLLTNEYYANPSNQFWKILAQVIGEDFDLDYPLKIGLLKRNGIALWDSVHECRRKGSSDKDMEVLGENNIENILKQYPRIRAIFYNGRKPEKHHSLGKLSEKRHREYLPSTSSALARPLQKKILQWKAILKFI